MSECESKLLRCTKLSVIFWWHASFLVSASWKNLFLGEVNPLRVHEKIISLVRANKKKDYCTTARREMNSNSGPNTATVTTRTCPPAFLRVCWQRSPNHSLSLSEDDLTIQRPHKLFQRTRKPSTKRHEPDITADSTLLAWGCLVWLLGKVILGNETCCVTAVIIDAHSAKFSR